MKLSNFVLAIITLAVSTVCWAQDDENLSSVQKSPDGNITVEQAKTMIAENLNNLEFLLIDVRTPDEYKSGRIENSLLIDFKTDDFKDKISKLDRSKKILLSCRSGQRSGLAKTLMEDIGFTEVYNMIGGIIEWTQKGYILVE
jgi:rhodanese-related sulfurtransferase